MNENIGCDIDTIHAAKEDNANYIFFFERTLNTFRH